MISIHFFDIATGILIFCLMFAYLFKTTPNVLDKNSNSTTGLIGTFTIGLIFILLFGSRDYSSAMAGDSWLYAYSYESLNLDSLHSDEWVWTNIIKICRNIGLTTGGWFTVIATIYILPVIIGCYRIAPNNTFTLFLAFISSFLFISNGLNGIRNGAACSLAFCALCYAMNRKNTKDWIICVLLCILAYGMHHSTIILIIPMIASIFIIKSIKHALYIWVCAIVISLLFGNTLAYFVADFSSDDRALEYLQAGANAATMEKFTDTGFRFDFLLFSMLPIIVGYYVCITRKISDKSFTLLLNTYILSNSIWIIFIYASYSNRFAMLSWFIYPFVLLYPYIRFKLWDNERLIYNTKAILWLQYLTTLILRYK